MEYDALIEEYLAGPDFLRRTVAGMTREQLLARPIPGKWSTHEVVCHLADYKPIYADRMKRVIALDEPELLPGDPGRYFARDSRPAAAKAKAPGPFFRAEAGQRRTRKTRKPDEPLDTGSSSIFQCGFS